MRTFFIITNHQKDPELSITRAVADYLRERGATVHVRSAEGKEMPRHTRPEEIPEGTECILVLGGDGTLMRAAGDLAELEIPLLGVNLGTLGYLAEIDRASIFPAMDALLSDTYQIENRMMLQGRVLREKTVLCTHTALNDIVVSRDGPPHIIHMQIEVNGKHLNEYRADGLIVSTPTGSTGYSLSAGGPIISPQASLFLLTPLAAHTLSARSVILPSENRIQIRLLMDLSGREEPAIATFDGENSTKLQAGDCVEIIRSDRVVRFVKIQDDSFLEILRRKLN